MDTKTRHALKKDKFATATFSGLDWIDANRKLAIVTISIAVVAAAIIIASALTYSSRSTRAQSLFGQAMDIYNTPIAVPGQPTEPGMTTYPSAAARAKAANPLFVEVADKYDWQKVGKNAEYFAGLTYLDLGQSVNAQKELQMAANSSDHGLADLARVALAGLYRQTGRNTQAADLYQQVIKNPSVTVPASEAKLQLAGLYENSNPTAARKLYAEIKDQDKGTAAAQIASQKLSGK